MIIKQIINNKTDHQTNVPAKYFSIRLADQDCKDFQSCFLQNWSINKTVKASSH
jgi:hypothetical protein